MPGIPLDALAQVKRGLRSLFSRRKKKKQPTQPEPTPSSNAPIQTITTAVAPVEAPTTSKRSVTDAEDAHKHEDRPPHPAADPTPTTATPLLHDPPPVTTTPPTLSDQPSDRKPHISVPSQIEEAKGIDLNPASDVKTESADAIKPIPRNETGMSATSGPMGDHMAEVWRDSDVGSKEGRPNVLDTKAAETAHGQVEGDKF